ncbi:hypothetical protein [Treponema sp.]|uniref:hypothetical protein n=1 Tax=Treponema sp. TaxID=166 RepID=UPI00257CA446|nr:hypothetical protein [Treponema sp.]MBE6354794.1 hypothetical protein [Treponema sp.]
MKKLILTVILFSMTGMLFSQTAADTAVQKENGQQPSVTVTVPASPVQNRSSKKTETPEDDQQNFTFSTTQTMSLMNSSSKTYFSIPADSEEAAILEITPVNETLFKLVIAVPVKNSTYHNFVIYVKKGEILGIKSKGAVFIGSVENFDYNSFTILGKRF